MDYYFLIYISIIAGILNPTVEENDILSVACKELSPRGNIDPTEDHKMSTNAENYNHGLLYYCTFVYSL